MNTVADVYRALNTIAPFALTMNFDNTGILVGDPNQEVKKALLALDCTSKTIALAKERGVQLIVTHHPVIFHPLKSLTEEMRAYQLIQSGLSVISAHTNLDLAEGGVNDVLAARLGLDGLSGLAPQEKGEFGGKITLPEPFLGRVGELAESFSAEEFAGYVKRRLQAQVVRYTQGSRFVRRVAVCSGSGASCIGYALSAGADALVTGDVKYDQFIDAAEAGLTLVDAGHFDTEDIVLEPLCSALDTLLPDIEWTTTHLRTIHSV